MMVVRVIDERIAVASHAANQIGIGSCPKSRHTERGLHVILLERRENPGGVASICARIECERHHSMRGLDLVDDAGKQDIWM